MDGHKAIKPQTLWAKKHQLYRISETLQNLNMAKALTI